MSSSPDGPEVAGEESDLGQDSVAREGDESGAEPSGTQGQRKSLIGRRRARDAGAVATLPSGAIAPLSNDETPLSAFPEVVMSDAHAATCLVKVGDAFPTASLVDLAGKSRPLEELFGKKLTVVIFWSNENLYSIAELKEAAAEIHARFGEQGVSVIGINVGDDPAVVARRVGELELLFPQLLDRERTLYTRIATGALPRTYLVDSQGKVVWLDIEYSRTTRRTMLQAVRFAVEAS